MLAFELGVVVDTILEELRGGAVHSDRDVLARYIASLLDSLEDRLDSVLRAVEGRGEATFVTYGRAQTAVMQYLLEGVEDLSTHAETFAEAACTDRADHEFLEGDRSIRVRAPVDDVHHRHRQYVGVGTADVAIEGDVEVLGSSLSHGERDAEDSVSAELALGLGAVKGDHLEVDLTLVEGAHTIELRGDDVVDVLNSLEDALTEVAALVSVTELESFVFPCGGTTRYSSAADDAASQMYVYLYGRIPTRVEDLAADDLNNFHI